MEKDKEIVIREDSSPMDYASQFLKYGGDMANLEKMLELQERHDANQARKAFHEAMSEFKKTPPVLKKNKKVAYGTTAYSHADLGDITGLINSALAEHGLNAIWKTDQTAGIKVTCIITHELGYSQETSLSSPPDTSGGKNSIQAIGSTITYLQRYTLLALTGLAAHDQDDDGKGSEPVGLSDAVKEAIGSLKTPAALTAYYKKNSKDHKKTMKEFVAALADRKADLAAVAGV